MRSKFDEQLITLNNNLIEMAAMVETAIASASKALSEQDIILAKNVITGDSSINEKEKEIESLCLKLILNQQPVARDLRQISSALKMITDLERVGDQASDICKIIISLFETKGIMRLEHLNQMAEATKKMVNKSIDAFVTKDLEMAEWVINSDDIVDDLYLVMKKDLIELIHKDIEYGEQAFELMQIAKYYERIGDHAVNIAEWVIFSITGKSKNTQIL